MLENQIVFHGGIYSQNTVGGAVLAQDKTDSKGRYILPGGNRTNDLDKAVRYDLSFLRMKSFKKDQDTWTKKYNAGRDEAVVILLNQDTIQSPPPGFHE